MSADTEIIDGEAEEIGQELELRSPASPTLFRTDDPAEVVVKATAAAKPLAQVIKKQKLYKTIKGKNHVLVEGWTLLGSMLGVVPVVIWTRKIEGGWEARVEARTEAMLAGGLIEETRALVARYGDGLRPLRAIGYRQAVAVVRGELDPAAARRDIVTGTMQYAKRQRTWFRHQADVSWCADATQGAALVEAWLR